MTIYRNAKGLTPKKGKERKGKERKQRKTQSGENRKWLWQIHLECKKETTRKEGKGKQNETKKNPKL